MKLLHLGDLHLGRSLGEYDLEEDQKYILDQILEIVKSREADGVLIAGDVYDKAVPSEKATRLLDYFLSSLLRLDKKVFMISGNHDSDERLNYGSSIFAENNIYIAAKYDGNLKRQSFDTGEEVADIYLMPFVKASQVKNYFPEAKIDSYDEAVRTVLEKADIDRTHINILLAHQFVTGKTEDPALSGSEGAGTRSVGLVEKVGYDCFDAFDYVALGHIHSPQRVGREGVRYSGSPLKYSLSEVNNSKSAVLVTIEGKGEPEIELIPLKPLRDLRHIRGKFMELLDRDNVKAPEDFIYATLTDEETIDDAMNIFLQIYPNTVKIDYDNSHTRKEQFTDLSQITMNKSYSEIIEDFYRYMYGCDISEEEMAVMREVAGEAGVTDETR